MERRCTSASGRAAGRRKWWATERRGPSGTIPTAQPPSPPLGHAAFTRTKPITPQLTKVLEELATSGRSRFEWVQLKALIGAKMIQVCNEYNGGQPDVGERRRCGGKRRDAT